MEAALPFADFLAKRNIDAAELERRLPEVAARWQAWYAAYHPESFLAQTKFEINAVRRRLQDKPALGVDAQTL